MQCYHSSMRLRLQMVLLLFAIPVFAGLLPETPSQRELLACKEIPVGPSELKFDCPGASLRVSVDAARELEDKLLDATVTVLENKGARVERTTLAIGKVLRKTIRWSTDAQRGLLLYVPAGASRIRMLSCEADELARCTPFLEALAARLARSQ